MVLLMVEFLNENSTGPDSSLTNQTGQTPLHLSDRPKRAPAMKGLGSGEPLVRPAACIWLYQANDEDVQNKGPTDD